MARTPYIGIPEAAAQTSVPTDYSNVQPRIGSGLEQAGQGFSEAADFYARAAVDNQFNDGHGQYNDVLYGTPGKTVAGPDGQMVPDTGFFGLRGKAAMEARPQVEQKLNQIYDSLRAGLQTPEQKNMFDTTFRRFRADTLEKVGSHTDQQSIAWYSDVNDKTGQQAQDAIAGAPFDMKQFQISSSDLINSRVKQAQLAGAQSPSDSLWREAVASGKRDALKAQVLAMSITDPQQALDILKKSQAIAGTEYYPLYKTLETKADEASGKAFVSAEYDKAHQAATTASQEPKPNTQTGQMFSGLEQKNGLPSGFLARTMQIESGGRNTGPNSAGAEGYFQFIPSTAARMGVNPRDLGSSADGAARLAAENARYLRTGLGREPSGGELYLAHQQGAKGAYELLSNPNAPASSIVGTKAVIQNGGREDMTAGEFANMWINKFNGTHGTTNAQVLANPSPQGTALPDMRLQPTAPQYQSLTQPPQGVAATAPEAPAPTPVHSSEEPVQPLSLKADVYQAIADNKDLSDGAKAHAFAFANQMLASQQMMYEANEREKKQKNENAANGIMKQILTGDMTNVMQEIATSPDLEWQTRQALSEAALKHSGSDVDFATKNYGPGFWDAFKAVTAPDGDPGRINDTTQLLRRAGPSGDLTLSGVQKLSDLMKEGQSSVDKEAINATRMSLMTYAKSKLSFEQDTGPIKIRDPKGEAIFTSQFIPKFMASYDAWTKQGKDPWQFLTKENVDNLADGMRSASQMAQDRIAAVDEAANEGAPASEQAAPVNLPPPPANTNTQAWNHIMATPPATADGKPFPPDVWANIVTTLATNPTPEMMAKFDNSKFGQKAGYKAEEIVKSLQTPEGQTPPPVQILSNEDRNAAAMRKSSIGHVR